MTETMPQEDWSAEHTNRGFVRIGFKDLYGLGCSIQESSLAGQYALWLGANEGTHVEGQCLARMHISQEMAAEMIVLLSYFVENGYLPAPPETEHD